MSSQEDTQSSDLKNGSSYRVLVCGGGRLARELLLRLGDGWEVTIIDPNPLVLDELAGMFPTVGKTFASDASSPVVLSNASLDSHEYVLALTDSDAVNEAVAKYATEKGVPHVLAMAREASTARSMTELGVEVIHSNAFLAQKIHRYLQDPRMHVTPLMLGPAAVYEVRASDHFRVQGKRAGHFSGTHNRLSGIFRQGKLIFPRQKTPIRADDRLIILGEPDIFQRVCQLLECGNPHFPLAYGPNLLVAITDSAAKNHKPLISEGMYITRNTQVKTMTVLCPEAFSSIQGDIAEIPQDIQIETRLIKEKISERIRELARDGSYGLVVVPQLERSFFSQLVKPTLMGLAHEIECPILVAKQTVPYERILIPFSGSPQSEMAFEIAVDLGRQLGSELAVGIVEVPEFLSGEEQGEGVAKVAERIKELGRIHKVTLNVIVRKGNPVRELVELSKEYDLMIVGSSNPDKGLISPNIGENLTRKAECSVLVVAG